MPPPAHDSSSAVRESLAVLSCLPERIESVSSSADLKQGTSNTAPSASSTRPLEPDEVPEDVVRLSARIQAGDAASSRGGRKTAPAAPEDLELKSSSTNDHEGWKEVRTDVVYSLDLGAASVEKGKGAGAIPFPTLHAWSSSANPCRLPATPTGSCMTRDQEPARPASDPGVVQERENDYVSPLPKGECHCPVIVTGPRPGWCSYIFNAQHEARVRGERTFKAGACGSRRLA